MRLQPQIRVIKKENGGVGDVDTYAIQINKKWGHGDRVSKPSTVPPGGQKRKQKIIL